MQNSVPLTDEWVLVCHQLTRAVNAPHYHIDSSTGPVEKEDLPPGPDDEAESQPGSDIVLRKYNYYARYNLSLDYNCGPPYNCSSAHCGKA